MLYNISFGFSFYYFKISFCWRIVVCRVVLVSAAQQNDSATQMHMHTPAPFRVSPCSRSAQCIRRVLTRCLLHTYASSVRVSVPISQFHPLSPLVSVYLAFPGGTDDRVCLQSRRPGLHPRVRKTPCRREQRPLQCSWGFPGGALYACASISALQMRSFMPFVPLHSYLILPLSLSRS